MPTPEQLRLAMQEKDSFGNPAFTSGQLAGHAMNDDAGLAQKIRRAMEMGVSKEQALNYYAYGSAHGLPEQKPKSNFFQRLWDDVKQRSAKVGEIHEQYRDGKLDLGSAAFQTAAQPLALGMNDTLGEAATSLLRGASNVDQALTGGVVGDAATGLARQAAQTGPGMAVIGTVKGVAKKAGEFAQAHPLAAGNLMAAGEIAAALPVGKVAGATGKVALNVAGEVADVAAGVARKAGKVAKPVSEFAGAVAEKGKQIGGAVVRNVGEAVDEARLLKTLPQPEATALRAGLDQPIIDFVKSSGNEDLTAYQRMFDIAKRKAGDLRVMEQPKQVAGESVLSRVKHIIEERGSVGAQKRALVEKMPNQPMNITNEYQGFLGYLRDRGIEVKGDGTVRSIGSVPDSDMTAVKSMLDMLAPNEKGQVLRTPKRVDDIRMKVFKELNLAKARQQPFSEDIDRIAEAYRSILMKPMGDQYQHLSELYATMSTPLEQFVRKLGYKGDLEQISGKSLKTGEIASRILGNASGDYMDLLSSIENIARKTGFKAKDDMLSQVRFSDLLENFFGTSQTRSLRGEVGRAGVDTAAESLYQNGIRGIPGRIVRAALRPGSDEQVNALEALIKSLKR